MAPVPVLTTARTVKGHKYKQGGGKQINQISRVEQNMKNEKDKIENYDAPLRCKLTDDELLARGQDLAEAQTEISSLEDSLASISSEYKAKIKMQEARIAVLSGTIRAKQELRQVKCQRLFVFKDGVVREVRLDTDEIINHREMTTEERQQNLEL